MTFNFKKNAQKTKDSVLPISTGLLNNQDKHNLSLQDMNFVPNFNTMLDKDRRPIEGTVVTHEAMLDEKRKKAAIQDKVTEGALEEVDSSLYPHRQFKDGEDNYQVSPINALSQINDSKFREAFSEANTGSDTDFWDKYVGDQLDGPITKVPTNITNKGSQLQNNPERFGKNKNLPSDPSAIINRDNFGAGVDVSPMAGSAKGKKGLTLASLNNADKLLFGIYLKASQESRNLNEEEQDIVNGINRDKKAMLLSLAQVNPLPMPNPSDPINKVPTPEEVAQTEDPRNADFLDGSPNDQQDLGDSSYWSSQSGFGEGRPGILDAAETITGGEDISFGDMSQSQPQPSLNAPIEQDPSFDNGASLVGQNNVSDNATPVVPTNENGKHTNSQGIDQNVEETPF